MKDLKPTDTGLQCERCIAIAERSEFAASPLLTEKNWMAAVRDAVMELPNDLQASVGHSTESDQSLIVSVAGEPISKDDRESHISEIEVIYWQTHRELGWPQEYDALFGPGGIYEAQVDRPVISVEGEAMEGADDTYFPDRATMGQFKRAIQLAILEEMYSGGGMSLISKNQKGHFIRENGQKIFDWQ